MSKANLLDKLGRIVIPKLERDNCNIRQNDLMEAYINTKGNIVLRKYHNRCQFCGAKQPQAAKEIENWICDKCQMGLEIQRERIG